MLLHGAVERLAACAAPAAAAPTWQDGAALAGDAVAQGTPAAAAWAAVVGRLLAGLPGSTGPQNKQLAAKQAQGLVPGWTPPAPLLRSLVVLCLPALASCSHQSSLDSLAASGESGSGFPEQGEPAATAALAAALQGVLRLLLDTWRGAGASSAAAARGAALLAQAQLPGPAQQQQAQQQPTKRGALGASGSAAHQQAAAEQGGDVVGRSDDMHALGQQLHEAELQVEALRAKRAGAAAARDRPR